MGREGERAKTATMLERLNSPKNKLTLTKMYRKSHCVIRYKIVKSLKPVRLSRG